MSKINELIQTLCPDGVEWKKLGDVCDIITGKLNANAAVVNGKYMFFTCDSEPSHIDKYAFDTDAILISGNGSQVGHLHSYCGKFNAYQRTYVLDNFDRLVMKAYLYNYMNGYLRPYIMSNCRKGSVPYITLPMLQSFQIPIPHIAVQEEIVRILNEYTELEAELEAKLSEEIELKQKQYEFYRDELLTFGDDVERKKLGEVAEYAKARIPATDVDENTYVGVDNLLQNCRGVKESANVPADGTVIQFLKKDILIGNIRPYLKKAWLADRDGGTNGDVLTIRVKGENEISPDFLYVILSSDAFFEYDMLYSKGSKMLRGDKSAVMMYDIPVPSPTEQERIVKILDKYDTYTRDMISTLNTELEFRKKQYAYYRDQLLTFKRKE